MFTDDLSDESIDGILAALENATSPYSFVHLRGLGGAIARVPSDATAFAHRQRRYMCFIISIWMDADEDGDPHRAWVQSLWEQLRHEGSGVYVNFLEREADRIHDAYPPATFERLTAVKRQYDPQNVFCFNQNIRP
jgi:FAD/FMN-containing dehydrogenase